MTARDDVVVKSSSIGHEKLLFRPVVRVSLKVGGEDFWSFKQL